ncbi:MAG: zinc-dependent alcohol dehydrogenase [Thermodesulfobacteriota bacterium]
MKAVVFRKGKGLTYAELPTPKINSREVLIKVANTGFCGSDHTLIESGLLPDGYILGHETSGIVVELGAAVQKYKVGEKVIIRPTFCGQCPECIKGKPHLCSHHRRTIGIGDLPGGFAEYVKALPEMLILIPQNVDSRSAALAETFASALHGINCTGRKEGSALVLGGGPIGLAAIRLLNLLGFGPIALAEPKEKNRELAKIFGADYVFDPLTADLALVTKEITVGWGWEIVLECSGLVANVSLASELVAKGGIICIISILFQDLIMKNPLILNLKEFLMTGSFSNTHEENKKCLYLMAEGKIKATALITDFIPLEFLPAVYKEKIHPGKSIKVMLQIGEEF